MVLASKALRIPVVEKHTLCLNQSFQFYVRSEISGSVLEQGYVNPD